MDLKSIHQLLPFSKILKFLAGFSAVIQLIVILYNHFSGYHELSSFAHFIFRLLRGTSLSILFGFLLIYPDLFLIRHLNKTAPWNRKILLRVLLETGFAVLTAFVVSVAFTMLAHLIRPYSEALPGVLIANGLIFPVVNILVMAILEGWLFYTDSKRAEQMAKNLQEELSQIKFEVLKSQINPHFMFNSLNVLSGLIEKDTAKAQQFIDEFSHIYRYVLETIEQPVASLEKELDFMRSYLFLQQIRYGNDLTYSINIPSGILKKSLPPLSLQVVLENAIKHNVINETKPLRIDVYCEDDFLMVRNGIQPKITLGKSTGLGLKNLTKRYALICNQPPEFSIVNNDYIARLPLIEID